VAVGWVAFHVRDLGEPRRHHVGPAAARMPQALL
jgi:hypothetical protein